MSKWRKKLDIKDSKHTFYDEHRKEIEIVFAALPAYIARNVVNNKYPNEIWEKEETQKYAFLWKISEKEESQNKELWHIGIVNVSNNKEVEFKKCDLENDFTSTFLEKYPNIEAVNFPEWKKFQVISREEYSAIIEIIRAALPTDIARNSLNNGCPDEIWKRDKSPNHAFVWKTSENIYGFDIESHRTGIVNVSPETGVEFHVCIIENDFDDNFLQKYSKVSSIDFTDQLWSERSISNIESSKEPSHESKKQSLENIIEQIQKAKALIDTGRGLGKPIQKFGVNNWEALEIHQKKILYKALANVDVNNFTLEENELGKFVISVRKLPFYINFDLYRIVDQRRPHSLVTYLVIDSDGTDACLLGTSSPPIHEFNRRRKNNSDLTISRESSVDYLKFFCRFVHGEEGAFPIIEEKSDLKWVELPYKFESNHNRTNPEDVKKATISELEPVRLYKKQENQGFTSCRAFCGYGRDLFIAEFKILHDTGMVEMLEDTPCHEHELLIEPLSFNSEYQFILEMNKKLI